MDLIKHAMEQTFTNAEKPVEHSYYVVLDFHRLNYPDDDYVDLLVKKGSNPGVDGYLFQVGDRKPHQPNASSDYPLKYVSTAQLPMELFRPMDSSNISLLLKTWIRKSMDAVLDSIQSELLPFLEQAPLLDDHPLRARMGLQEGVRLDDRFFVYEYRYNPSTFSTEKKFRGVVRATRNIVDDRQNQDTTGSTVFYQTYGRSLKPGYLLERRSNGRMEWSLTKSSGGIGGWSARLDVRVSRSLHLPSMYLYFEGGYEPDVWSNSYSLHGYNDLYRLDLGLAKGFYLFHNLELRPFVGVGVETSSFDMTSKGRKCEYVQYGANLYLPVNRFLKVFGGISQHQFIPFWSLFDPSFVGYPWSYFFYGRNAGNLNFGVTVEL